jgi:hypothetical protein
MHPIPQADTYIPAVGALPRGLTFLLSSHQTLLHNRQQLSVSYQPVISLPASQQQRQSNVCLLVSLLQLDRQLRVGDVPNTAGG